MPMWGSLGLQDSASPLMEQLTYFHDHTMLILILITTLVGYILINSASNLFINRFLLENQEIEIIWTILLPSS